MEDCNLRTPRADKVACRVGGWGGGTQEEGVRAVATRTALWQTPLSSMGQLRGCCVPRTVVAVVACWQPRMAIAPEHLPGWAATQASALVHVARTRFRR